MTKKSSKFLNIWITVFMYIFLIVILGTGASNIDYNIPSAFSQGNNPPAGITTFTECPQIAFSGPTYTGPNGCEQPCPTNPINAPPGCSQQHSLTLNKSLHEKTKHNRWQTLLLYFYYCSQSSNNNKRICYRYYIVIYCMTFV